MGWIPAPRGGYVLTETGYPRDWKAWVEDQWMVAGYRKKGSKWRYLGIRWTVWVWDGKTAGIINHMARCKTKAKAMRLAEATLRIMQ